MKTVTFEEARTKFDSLFQLAVAGETVVIERDQQKVALCALADPVEPAPPGYFAHDYSREEAAELNSLASHGPQFPLP